MPAEAGALPTHLALCSRAVGVRQGIEPSALAPPSQGLHNVGVGGEEGGQEVGTFSPCSLVPGGCECRGFTLSAMWLSALVLPAGVREAKQHGGGGGWCMEVQGGAEIRCYSPGRAHASASAAALASASAWLWGAHVCACTVLNNSPKFIKGPLAQITAHP